MLSRKIVLGQYRGEIASAFDTPDVRAVLADPKRLASGPAAELLHEGRNRLAAAGLRLGPDDRLDVVIKEYRSYGIDRAKSLFRVSKAARAWRGAAALADGGFATPSLIAFLERRRGGFVVESFYIAERVRGAAEIRGLWPGLAEADLGPLVTALARTLRAVHDRGIFHRDLSDGNILVARDGREFRFIFLDTNRIRLRRRIGPTARARNLVRLGIPPRLRAAFLEGYAAVGGHPPGAYFVFWYNLAKAAFASWLGVKKALRLRKIARSLKIQ